MFIIHDIGIRRLTPSNKPLNAHEEIERMIHTSNISPDDMEKEAYDKLLKLCDTFESCDNCCDKCKKYVIDGIEMHKELMKWRDSL